MGQESSHRSSRAAEHQFTVLLLDFARRTSVTFIELSEDNINPVPRGRGLACGSGTLFTAGGRFFVLTAQHVAEDALGAPNAWMVADGGPLIPERPIIGWKGSGEDPDAAVLEIDPAWVRARGLRVERNFIGFDQVAASGTAALTELIGDVDRTTGKLLAIFGSPNARTSMDLEARRTEAQPLLFSGDVRGLDMNARATSFEVSYGDEAFDEGDAARPMPLPEPHGMSGGGAWIVPAGERIVATAKLLLAGVQLQYNPRRQTLRVGPIDDWLSLLAAMGLSR